MALRDELHSWLATQPAWQQDLAKRLTTRASLDGDAYEEALRVVKAAFGALDEGETAPEPLPLTLDDLPAGPAAGAPRLLAFGRLRGVGAVSPDHELRFAEAGLTVIYGQNAVGKTTYVRALKRVCRTIDRDAEVRGNVFARPDGGGAGPSAKVELSMGGDTRAQQLDLTTPADLGLQAISVFDSQCAELYVDAENAVAYVPAVLRLLARLAATQDQMRGDLDGDANALTRGQPSFAEFTENTAVDRALNELSASTRLEDVQALASLSDEERARMAELRAALASQETATARVDAQAAQHDARQAESLAAQLRELAARIASPARERLRGLAADSATAEQAVEVARQEFAGLPVPGVGGGPWRQLWEAARSFVAAGGAEFPPPAGAACPFCLQEVSTDAASRLAHFEEHVRGSVQQDARGKREALGAALDALDTRQVEDCRTPFLAGLREREPELHAAVARYLEAVKGQLEALRADPAAAKMVPPAEDAPGAVEAWGRARAARAQTLLAADDAEQEQVLRAELAELEARTLLAPRLSDVEQWLATLRRAAALRRAYSALATNRITIKQRQLSEEVVTGALDAKLRDELGNLDCSHIPVDLLPQTSVGETQLALRLAGAHGTPKISDIASEGEQRALSLSFFLAEVATSESDGGIIVDDPVSSLDDERRDYIAKRLVAETENRQVVVFTHDLPFMLDLLDRAEEAGLEPLVQGVWRMGAEVGRVDDHPPFKAMKLKQRIGVLDQEVAQWDNREAPRDFDEAWRRVCDFYARLRITWERGVEERLFKGVVTRFQREVKTLALDDVQITPEMVALVKEGMTRCSMFVHDEPPGAGTRLPDRVQLARDLDKLREFVQLTR
jgi:ABC-type cobalamin/Fe3+-siderophores transport system ATPase subunit